MGISLSNRQKRVEIDTRKIKRAGKKILSALGCERSEVSLVIVNDEEITRLNRQYFQRNRPTNVIAFPMAAGDPDALNPHLLGDVVVSAETAERHSYAAGGKTEEEIIFLVIHGILHLLGYDHEGSPAERRKMETKERELFNGVGGFKGPRVRGAKLSEGRGQKRNSDHLQIS
ncbi:MAG: rRNA maturation RNase YbeY [Deltaproteobacteria bacterium]|nr:rRNA maturation RNase YbeY [Deltaproteobacteria bacterium]